MMAKIYAISVKLFMKGECCAHVVEGNSSCKAHNVGIKVGNGQIVCFSNKWHLLISITIQYWLPFEFLTAIYQIYPLKITIKLTVIK